MDKIIAEASFNAICDAYRAMYFSAKNDKELKDRINSFRAGNIIRPNGTANQTTSNNNNNGTMD